MGWASGNLPDGTPVGYSVGDVCHEPGCTETINRGLYYVCGSMHGGDGIGCGGYFCPKHMYTGYRVPGATGRYVQLCQRCGVDFDDDDEEPTDAQP